MTIQKCGKTEFFRLMYKFKVKKDTGYMFHFWNGNGGVSLVVARIGRVWDITEYHTGMLIGVQGRTMKEALQQVTPELIDKIQEHTATAQKALETIAAANRGEGVFV